MPSATDTPAPDDEPPGAADEHSTSLTQPAHNRGVARRQRLIVQHGRAGARALPGDVEQVLDRDRQSGERRKYVAGLAQLVLGIGGAARTFGINLQEHPRALAGRVGDRGERLLNQGAARGSPRGKVGC
jgi:hypothetical protein